jgi:8-oxo-dGTP pyrophosphatase MutT (NUDIX family)
MIQVFYNNIAIVMSEKILDKEAEVVNFLAIDTLIERLKDNYILTDVVLTGNDPKSLFIFFSKHFKYIEAAGGVVKNRSSEYLIIKRMGIWDLPKGKIEKDENIKDAAIREVCEETGLSDVKITGELPHTFHIYNRKEKWYLKKTYWFSMATDDDSQLVPQTEEDITDAVWMIKNSASMTISQSYRSIYDTLGTVFE